MTTEDHWPAGIGEFEWDAGNSSKNWGRHRVTQPECEQVLLGQPLVLAPDTRHSTNEARFFALGQTDTGRQLMVVFTIRGRRLRVISARPMSRRERRIYAEAKTATQEPPAFQG